MTTFSYNNFLEKCKKYHEKETRDLTYVMARNMFKNWPKYKEEALRLLLADWNRRHIVKFSKLYQLNNQLIKDIRGAMKSFNELENKHPETFSRRLKDIDLDNAEFGATIKNAFKIFQEKELIFGVGAAKSLHLLYPDIFVMWDSNIYRGNRQLSSSYLKFMKNVKNELVIPLLSNRSEEKIWEDHCSRLNEKIQQFYSKIGFKESLLKMIDEYNYIIAIKKRDSRR